jgi:hypothetical protein
MCPYFERIYITGVLKQNAMENIETPILSNLIYYTVICTGYLILLGQTHALACDGPIPHPRKPTKFLKGFTTSEANRNRSQNLIRK